MIFPYSFRKAYLANNGAGGAVPVQTAGSIASFMTSGSYKGVLGFCTVPNGIEGAFISSGTPSATMAPVKLVCGSWHTVDKIAPFYGGLQAPLYSKSIDPRRITNVILSKAQPAQQQIVNFGWNTSVTGSSAVGPVFYCGTPYFLRLDMQGSPTLRLLNHPLYINLPAFGGCCGTDCSSGCTATTVDAASIMLQWKDFILSTTGGSVAEVPYLQQFFLPAVFILSGTTKTQVYSQADSDQGRLPVGSSVYVPNTVNPSSVIASFQLTGSYVQTTYGNCTFTPTDHFQLEPVFCKGSLITQDYSPCPVNTTINTSVPNMFYEIQAPKYPKGLGEQVVRELILSQRYKQEHFSDSIYADSLRMRETEDDVTIPNVDRAAYYDSLAIVYNITRPQNVTSLHNNDQYCDIIYAKGVYSGNTYVSPDFTPLTNILTAMLSVVGSSTTLVTTASDGTGI